MLEANLSVSRYLEQVIARGLLQGNDPGKLHLKT